MKSEVKNQLSPLEEFAFDVIKEKFESLSEKCEYRFADEEGRGNCHYHDSSIGYCKAELCPRLSQEMEEDEG